MCSVHTSFAKKIVRHAENNPIEAVHAEKADKARSDRFDVHRLLYSTAVTVSTFMIFELNVFPKPLSPNCLIYLRNAVAFSFVEVLMTKKQKL